MNQVTLHILANTNTFALIATRYLRPTYLLALAYVATKWLLFWTVVLTVFYVQLALDLTKYLWNLSYEHTCNLASCRELPTWTTKRVVRLKRELVDGVCPVALSNLTAFVSSLLVVMSCDDELRDGLNYQRKRSRPAKHYWQV